MSQGTRFYHHDTIRRKYRLALESEKTHSICHGLLIITATIIMTATLIMTGTWRTSSHARVSYVVLDCLSRIGPSVLASTGMHAKLCKLKLNAA